MIDYGASGLIQRWEHALVDSRTLDEVEPLQGVTGYSLTESWRGDYRQTGSIDIDGKALPAWAGVRSWLVTTQDGETEREELATLLPKPAEIETRFGRELVTHDLQSPLVKLAGRRIGYDVAVPAGAPVESRFLTLCDMCGAVGWVHPAFTSASQANPRVWEAGDTFLTECHTIASTVGGRVEPDSYGRVCLVPYQLPALVSPSFEIEAGPGASVLPGVTLGEPEIVNQVMCVHSQDDRRYYSTATVDPTHPWSFERLGRWYTVVIEAPEIAQGANVQATLDAATAQALAAKTDVSRVWSVRMAYAPVRVGQAGTIRYIDSANMEPVELSGFVSAREVFTEGAAVFMELTIEEVPIAYA